MKFILLLIALVALFATGVNSQYPPWYPCPPPLLHVPNGTAEQGYSFIPAPAPYNTCAFPCQSMFFKENQWESFNNLTKKMGTVSFVVSVLVMISYGPLINRHFFSFDRHTVVIFFLSTATAFIGIADLMYAKDGNELICPEPNRYAVQSDEKCLANGIMYQFGWLGAVIFWAVLSVDGYLRVAGKQGSKMIFGIVVAVLYALIIGLTFGPINGNQYGYYPVGPIGCWILEKNWQYGFFWWVVVISLAVGFAAIVATVISFLKKTNDGNTFRHVMPFIMVILFFFQILYMICFYGVINDRKDQYTEILGKRITCMLKSMATSPDPYGACEFEHSIGFASHYTFLFFVKVLGIQVFAFLGLSKETLNLWKSSWLLTSLGLGDKDAYEVELDETNN